jgi:hypothetical protein
MALEVKGTEVKKQVVTIIGKTSKGKVFRPRNWCKRISGTASCFSDNKKSSYHKYVNPIWVSEEQVSGIEIDLRLKHEEPCVYGFVMQFAESNDLIIKDVQEETIKKAS